MEQNYVFKLGKQLQERAFLKVNIYENTAHSPEQAVSQTHLHSIYSHDACHQF